MRNAQQAFQEWLLRVEIIGGAACLLVFVVCIGAAVVLVANSRKQKQ